MEVRFVKLVNSEEFVAQVEVVENKLRFKNGMRFITAHNGNVGAMDFLPFCKEQVFEIDQSHVLLMGEVDTEIYNAYQEKYGGIVIAGPNLRLSD